MIKNELKKCFPLFLILNRLQIRICIHLKMLDLETTKKRMQIRNPPDLRYRKSPRIGHLFSLYHFFQPEIIFL